MKRLFCAALLCWLAVPAFGGGDAKDRPLWLAVGPPHLTAALGPLEKEREKEGLAVQVLAGPVKQALQKAGRRPAYLLLVGDDEPGCEKEAWYLAAERRPFYRWRPLQNTTFATDAIYGDLDGDLVPDIPVGRIPARTPKEVAAVVKKTLAFESRPLRAGDLRLVAWGGAPGYSPMIDAVATKILVTTIRTLAPPWAERRILSSSLRSPFCGWPPNQPAHFDADLKKGAVLGAIMAHAGPFDVYGMQFRGHDVLWGMARVEKDFAEGPPVAPLLLSTCYCGAFAGKSECLAEDLLFLPGGPVSVIAATTESHPLTNYYSDEAVLKVLAKGAQDRVGDLWLAAQKTSFAAREFLIEQALKDAEGSLEKNIDIAKLKRDQLLLYEFFGDPATHLRLPVPLVAEVQKTAHGWRWTAQKPEGATVLHVETRESDPQALGTPDASSEKAMEAALRKAQAAGAFTTVTTRKANEKWEGTIEKPCDLRLVAETPGGVAVFAKKLD